MADFNEQTANLAAEVDVSQQQRIHELQLELARAQPAEQWLRWLLSIAANSKDEIVANGRKCVRVAIPVDEVRRMMKVMEEVGMGDIRRPEWAIGDDGKPGNTMVPKLDMMQEHLARLASDRYEQILQLERDKLELSGALARAESETARLQGERDDMWKHGGPPANIECAGFKCKPHMIYGLSWMQREDGKYLCETCQLNEARERLRVMSEPVSDEEWAASQSEIVVPSHDFDPDDRYSVMFRDKVDALIKSRAALIGVEGQ